MRWGMRWRRRFERAVAPGMNEAPFGALFLFRFAATAVSRWAARDRLLSNPKRPIRSKSRSCRVGLYRVARRSKASISSVRTMDSIRSESSRLGLPLRLCPRHNFPSGCPALVLSAFQRRRLLRRNDAVPPHPAVADRPRKSAIRWGRRVWSGALGAWAAEVCRAHEVDRIAARWADSCGCTHRCGDFERQRRRSATVRRNTGVESAHRAALMPLAWHPCAADSAPGTRA